MYSISIAASSCNFPLISGKVCIFGKESLGFVYSNQQSQIDPILLSEGTRSWTYKPWTVTSDTNTKCPSTAPWPRPLGLHVVYYKVLRFPQASAFTFILAFLCWCLWSLHHSYCFINFQKQGPWSWTSMKMGKREILSLRAHSFSRWILESLLGRLEFYL